MTIAIATEWVKVPAPDLEIDAYVAAPSEPGHYPAVVVIQEIFGVNSHIRSVAERLARQGFVAIAPAIYQRTAPGIELNYTVEDMAIGSRHKELTTASQLLSDIEAVITYLRSRPDTNAESVGTIGFCFGGHVVYLAATLPAVQATASFYGAGIATFTPGGGAATLSRTAEIGGTVYAFYGTTDPLIPLEEIDQVEAALTTASDRHRVFRYAAGHGFFCDQRPDYVPAAAADAWEKVLELYRSAL
ncbi:dienelactone hydrolase family protein [Synechococcus elongatus IITB7]|uniref:dienelactone hydrolase family protein n=1 Tax=Synechococcus elongatus TaxID=32046 RepID=UPI0030D4A6C5